MILRYAPFLLLATFAYAASNHELCGTYQQYRTNDYTWNNNVWNDDGSGFTCTSVSASPSSSNNAFNVSWQWSSGSGPVVRAFPNIGMRNSLPLQLQDLGSLAVQAKWGLAPATLLAGSSTDPTTEPNAGALTANDVQADVCLDMFADSDPKRSIQYSQQRYEIMIWFGQFGNAAQPIGDDKMGIKATIQDVGFTLWNGTNANGQLVFSWIADRTLPSFNMDFAPLFGALISQDLVSRELYLGTVEFGTETFSADNKMNFSVSAFQASNKSGTPPNASLTTPTSTSSGSPAATTSKQSGACRRILAAWIPITMIMLAMIALL